MIAMQLTEAAQILGAGLQGSDAAFNGMSIDTRTLRGKELFVALAGERVDGHDLLDVALSAGASGAIVERKVDSALPQLPVADTRVAMGELAKNWRQRFAMPLVAVTGSNGKTTCKEMIAAIGRVGGSVLATQGNLNNDLGVPLTLAGLNEGHSLAVIEMGASHAGEIENLAAMAQPDVAMVTCCAPAHVEGFGSIEGVAQAKGEIYSALGENGTAIVNADDDFATYWRGLIGARECISFGFSADADVRAEDHGPHAQGRDCEIYCKGESIRFILPLAGRHNVLNAAASIAVGRALGCALGESVQGLKTLQAVSGRMQLCTTSAGAILIDDSYNANPASLSAALGVLSEYPPHRCLVLGTMAELGDEAEQYHIAAGNQARALGIEKLIGIGPLAGLAADAFGPGGIQVASNIEAVELLIGDGGDTTILVKGSRSAATDEVVTALRAEVAAC